MDLLTRFSSGAGGMAPTGHRQHVVPLPRNSTENSLRKIMKKFERDPTIGSIVMDMLTRFSSVVGGMAPTGRRQRVLPITINSVENRHLKIVKKI